MKAQHWVAPAPPWATLPFHPPHPRTFRSSTQSWALARFCSGGQASAPLWAHLRPTPGGSLPTSVLAPACLLFSWCWPIIWKEAFPYYLSPLQNSRTRPHSACSLAEMSDNCWLTGPHKDPAETSLCWGSSPRHGWWLFSLIFVKSNASSCFVFCVFPSEDGEPGTHPYLWCSRAHMEQTGVRGVGNRFCADGTRGYMSYVVCCAVRGVALSSGSVCWSWGLRNSHHRWGGWSYRHLQSCSSGDKVSQGWFPLRPLSLACRQLSPPHALTWSSLCACVLISSS